MASRIAGITVTIDGQTTGLQKSLSEVNKSINTTKSGLKDVERLLKLDPTNTELLSQKQKNLKDAIGNTKEKLDALKEAQKQAKEQLENGDLGQDKYDALQREIIATEQELQRLQQEAVNANEKLTKIGEAGRSLESFGNKMTSVGKGLTTHVTAPIVAVGAAAVKTTADFDSQMSKVAAISGATGDDFDALREKAREMGAKTKFSATEAGEAFEYMAMAGWKTGDMLDGIEGIMNLAAASGEDLGTTSDIVTDALTAFGLSAADSSHFADILATASSNANTNVGMMGETFKYVAPVAGSLGYSAEDVAESIGLMANAGIKSSQAGTSLRSIMTRLSTDAGASSKSLGALGILTEKLGVQFYNADGTTRDFNDVIADAREAWQGLTAEEQANYAKKIAGQNAISGWMALMNASSSDVDKLHDAIANCDGSAQNMAETMQDNLSGQLTILKSQLQELFISIGDSLMPAIRKIVEVVQGWVDKLNSMDQAQKDLIIRIALVVAAIGPFLVVVGTIISKVGVAMQAFEKLGKGVLMLGSNIKNGTGLVGKLATALGGISAPVLAVIAVIAVLAAAFVHLWKTNDEFREKIIAIWDGVKEKFTAATQKITEAINSLGFDFSGLGEAIKAAWDFICNALAPILEGIFAEIGQMISGIIDVVTGIVQVICGIIKGFKDGDWTLFLDGLKTLFTGFLELILAPFKGIFTAFEGYLEMFGTTWEEVWGSIKTFFEDIWNGIKDFFVGIWEGLKNTVTTVGTAIGTAVSDAFTAVKTTFETIWNGITSFLSAAWETIKNVVTVGVMLIGEILSSAFQIITLPFRFIWENCKDTIIAVWDFIREKISGVLETIKETISTVWTAIKDTLSPIIDGIKEKLSAVWDAIKEKVGGVVDAIKEKVGAAWDNIKEKVSTVVDGIREKVGAVWDATKEKVGAVVDGIKEKVDKAWDNMKEKVKTVMDGIKDKASTAWDAVKTKVGAVIDGIKSNIQSKFDAMKTYVGTAWDNIKTKITGPIERARDTVKSAIDRMKSFFNFSWSLPRIKLPHFSISGSFSLNPPRVPHFSISWYKKAMKDGMIMNAPTIFGMKGSTLLAGGDAGSETVVGTQSLLDMIRDAVAGMAQSAPTINYGGVTMNIYATEGMDIRELADEIEYRINNNVTRRRASQGR